MLCQNCQDSDRETINRASSTRELSGAALLKFLTTEIYCPASAGNGESVPPLS